MRNCLPRRHRPGQLDLEELESRLPLAGEAILINFQLGGVPIPTNYLADTGEVFANRGNGPSYGWSADHTDVSRDRGLEPDQRLDTLVHFHQFQDWELQLPNGDYEVTISIGDPEFPSDHSLFVEGVTYWNNVPMAPGDFLTMTQQVTVSDGRLTLDQGNAEEKATRINYIQVFDVPDPANNPPDMPLITEPAVLADDVNPIDVHMEATFYSDPDGDTHLSTDWELWTDDGQADRVWAAYGTTGVDRVHMHLGDGYFENSHAGRTDLLPDTGYELRTRFRDSEGAVSAFASRTFRTGLASTVFPLELDDVASVPNPTWTNLAGTPVDLPSGSPSPNLRLESPQNDLLLEIAGRAVAGNSVNNPAALPVHVDTRIVVCGGSTGLVLGETDLAFEDAQGIARTIFLPAMNLAASEKLFLWIAVDGSTYFGTVFQTTPNFDNLARESEGTVNFIATQPNYVVDVVAEGFQLPVNVAFIPNAGAAPDDPAFYVTELYGTIKVVTNAGAVSDYATGLLNFNPTGNFPGSGEQGLAGIAVEPTTGDVYVTRVTDTDGLPGGAHHPQVVRFTSNDGGKTAATETVILDMVGESQGQSHQISNITVGPDGKLYVHNGDGFDAGTGQNLASFRGKVLRTNLDGSPPPDNPLYNIANGIDARDYIYAYGFRNPFGGDWRASDGKHYTVENGPSVDRFAQVNPGVNYGWDGSDASMFTNAIYNWFPAHAPVNVTFVQPSSFGGSGFPSDKYDRAFVSESGPTYAPGPQARGKRIVEFELDANGDVVSGPTTLVEYVGSGRATVVGLTTGPDGLYFTDLYKDEDAATPIDPGARVLRVRYVPPIPDSDFNNDGALDCADVDALVAEIASGSHNSAFDLSGDSLVDAQDLTLWLTDAGSQNLSSGNPYKVGDANLDGDVDGQDFVIWNTNKFTSQAAWCSGDFTADGTVDGQDFIAWNDNKFQSADAQLAGIQPVESAFVSPSHLGTAREHPAALSVTHVWASPAVTNHRSGETDAADEHEDSPFLCLVDGLPWLFQDETR